LHYSEYKEKDEKANTKVILAVYILYGLSYLVGITYIVGVIIAYIKRDDAKIEWIRDHYRWQINTFWITLVLNFLGALTIFIGIGWVLILGANIWNIYRIVKGWLKLNDEVSPYEG